MPGGFAHGNGLIHLDTFHKIQGYDEEFIGYGPEDKLFNYRIGFFNKIIFDNLNDTSTFHLWHKPLSRFQERENMVFFERQIKVLKNNAFKHPEILIANTNKPTWGEI
jgi:predicted glycosyltransferase involved in capsule biosynthesis